MLQIEVRDNGAGLPDDDAPQGGVGLANIRARLDQLYPGAHAFTLCTGPGGDGTMATISIPFRLLRKDAR